VSIASALREIVVEILFRDLEYLVDRYMTDTRKVRGARLFELYYERSPGAYRSCIVTERVLTMLFACLLLCAGLQPYVLGRRDGRQRGISSGAFKNNSVLFRAVCGIKIFDQLVQATATFAITHIYTCKATKGL
jgi:hypothetical protein